MDALANDVGIEAIGSKATILPASVIGSPRYMKALMQDSIALCRRFGKPDYFITFTCNPKWPEILEQLEYGETPTDRPDIVARLYYIKLKALLDDLLNQYVLGAVSAYTYVIEYQKRGLPHAHILLIVAPSYRIGSDAVLDRTIRADIPPEGVEQRLRECVLKHMLYSCGDRCQDPNTKKCSKGFPKAARDTTLWLTDGGYPAYKRLFSDPNNINVVPYNPYLLLKFNAHINVELYSSVKSIQYLYKYVIKGSDAANIAIRRDAGDPPEATTAPVLRDEILEYQSARWLGASEACWRIFGFPTH